MADELVHAVVQPTYELAPDAPPAMLWSDYEAWLLDAWSRLLSDVEGEQPIQRFLEQHPSLVPGVVGNPSLPAGHAPHLWAVVSQPPLQGLGNRIPDFMWIARNSAFVVPVFVEIEAPRKRWFTNKGVPRAEWIEAHNQLTEWRAWIARPENQLVFRANYLSAEDKGRAIRPHFVLVVGRRSEFESKSELDHLRAALTGHDESLMTYDRLAPNSAAWNYMCVRFVREQTFEAVSVPPTLRVGPFNGAAVARTLRKVEAVLANELMSDERKRFLIDRFPYWEAWLARTGGFYGSVTGEAHYGE